MSVADRRLTEAEYLEIERAAEFKSEFFDGEMFAMAGGSRWHSLITSNLIRHLGNALSGGICRVFDSNLRVKVEDLGFYTYPDVVVSCETQRFADGEMDTLLNPTVLVEVLSPSTEAYDRAKKFENYRRIASLREYVLVEQDEPRVEQFVRQESGDWLLHEAAGIANRVSFPALKITLPLSKIFENVEFPSAPKALRPHRPR